MVHAALRAILMTLPSCLVSAACHGIPGHFVALADGGLTGKLMHPTSPDVEAEFGLGRCRDDCSEVLNTRLASSFLPLVPEFRVFRLAHPVRILFFKPGILRISSLHDII